MTTLYAADLLRRNFEHMGHPSVHQDGSIIWINQFSNSARQIYIERVLNELMYDESNQIFELITIDSNRDFGKIRLPFLSDGNASLFFDQIWGLTDYEAPNPEPGWEPWLKTDGRYFNNNYWPWFSSRITTTEVYGWPDEDYLAFKLEYGYTDPSNDPYRVARNLMAPNFPREKLKFNPKKSWVRDDESLHLGFDSVIECQEFTLELFCKPENQNKRLDLRKLSEKEAEQHVRAMIPERYHYHWNGPC